MFCLYSLEYDRNNDCFLSPDKRVREFGDTAVVICDFNEFLRRMLTVIVREKEHALVMMDRVRYFSPQENRKQRVPFEKSSYYSWQNELRLVYGDLTHIGFDDFRLTLDSIPKMLGIGDIRDIAMAMPIDCFLDLSFLPFASWKFPMSEKAKPPFTQKKTYLIRLWMIRR